MLKQSVIECLDRMERTIESGGRMLFSSSRIVDGVSCRHDRIASLCRRRSGRLSERSRIAAESGRVEAGPSGQAVAGVEVAARAREEAEAILAQARREAFDIRAGADEYAESTLSSLQETLDRTSFVVRKGIDELRRRKSDSDQ